MDPNNLTDEQERLLKLAIARQARHTNEERLNIKLRNKERLRAERDRRLQLLGDQKRLAAFLHGSRFAGALPVCSAGCSQHQKRAAGGWLFGHYVVRWRRWNQQWQRQQAALAARQCTFRAGAGHGAMLAGSQCAAQLVGGLRQRADTDSKPTRMPVGLVDAHSGQARAGGRTRGRA